MSKDSYNVIDSIFFFVYLVGAGLFSFYLIAAKSNHLELSEVGQVIQAISTKTAFRTSVFDSKASTYPIITKVRGDVILYDPKKGNRKPVIGDFFTKNMTLETKNGSVSFKFGINYQAKVRLEKNSKIFFDELMKKNPTNQYEKTIIGLDYGLLSLYVDKFSAANILVNTKTAALINKGPNLAVFADTEDFALIFTSGGTVDSESFASLKKYSIPGGSIYLISRTLGEKMVTKAEVISQFNWDQDHLEVPVIKDDVLASLMGSKEVTTSLAPPATPTASQPIDPNQAGTSPNAQTTIAPSTGTISTTTTQPNVQVSSDIFGTSNKPSTPPQGENFEDKNAKNFIIGKILAEIESFKKYDLEIANNLENAKKLVQELTTKIDSEKSKIEKDQKCLGLAGDSCTLFSENILRERGYEKFSGTQTYKQKLIDELNVYQKENAKMLEENKKIVQELPALQAKRAEVLKEAQSQFSSGKDLESIIDKLNSNDLFEKRP